MSDDFIPLNQSTPVRQKWQPGRTPHQRFQKHRNNSQNSYRQSTPYNKWNNSSRRSFTSNSSNTSFGQEGRTNIDAYLHPSMLQDPWESLQQGRQNTSANTSVTE